MIHSQRTGPGRSGAMRLVTALTVRPRLSAHPARQGSQEAGARLSTRRTGVSMCPSTAGWLTNCQPTMLSTIVASATTKAGPTGTDPASASPAAPSTTRHRVDTSPASRAAHEASAGSAPLRWNRLIVYAIAAAPPTTGTVLATAFDAKVTACTDVP